MAKVLGWTASMIGGTIGWWAGEYVGIMTAFALSILGTGLGLYFGRKLAIEYL